jgi:hypothetical protein
MKGPSAVVRPSRAGAAAAGLALLTLAAGCSSAPWVTSMEPVSGKFGDTVTLSGGHLDTATEVTFAGTPDPSPQVLGTGELTATVPVGAASGTVTVTTPKGTADAPYEFQVLATEFTEVEPNDQKAEANEVPDAAYVRGTFVAAGGAQKDVDWYKLKSGPPGPWAYTVEVQMENASDRELSLELQVKGESKAASPVPPGATVTTWVTTLDGKNVFLKVSAPGPQLPTVQPADYELRIGRIALEDPGEPNDYLSLATSVTLSGTTTTLEDHYFTSAWDPATSLDVGLTDILEIGGIQVGEPFVAIFNLQGGGLSSPLRMDLLDSNDILIDTQTASSADLSVLSVSKDPVQPYHLTGGDTLTVRITTVGGTEPTAGVGPAPGHCRVPYRLVIVHG